MEKNIEEQKTRYCCNSLRDVINSTSKDTCIIFCAHSQALLDKQSCKTVTGLAKEKDAILLALYVINIDIERYGQIDQLAPAGAMFDFCDYVRNQTEDEARQVFFPLFQQAQNVGLVTALHIVSKGRSEKEFIRFCCKKFTTLHLL